MCLCMYYNIHVNKLGFIKKFYQSRTATTCSGAFNGENAN